MLKRIIIISALLIVSFIVGLNLRNTPSELTTALTSETNNPDLIHLQNDSREMLARITSLEAQLSENQRTQEDLAQTLFALIENNSHSTQRFEEKSETFNTQPPPSIVKQNQLPLADRKTQALLALGIDGSITQRIQERKEKIEMDHLYLRDTAIREGWFGTEKYFEKTQEISQANNVYREELGDSYYDQYLFNVGQNNRVKISSVISHSPAENIGIQEGDIISQYDHKTIFSWSDLTQATSIGEANQEVSIVIQRNAENIELFIPRGPLGVRLENIKVNPSE